MSRTHYFMELAAVRQNLIQMGEATEQLFSQAVLAITEPSATLLEKASELEAQTDHKHRSIHDQCLSLITLQAPVARDARLVTGILDAIVDLELIGDYAYEIATLSAGMPRRPSQSVASQVSAAAGKIGEALKDAIDVWRGAGADAAPVRLQQTALRAECDALYNKLSQLTSTPGDAPVYVDLMLIARHLERILRHAVCVAEQGASAAPFDEATA
jgi:phosphate transport system protein